MSRVEVFQKAVRKYFDFLAAHDFTVSKERVEGEACFLTYSSPRVSILLCYGLPEYHAELAFWLNGVSEFNLCVGDLDVVGQRSEFWKAAPNTDGVEAEVSYLASAVRSVEEKLCSGDLQFYELMTSARKAAIAEWRQKEKLMAIRSQAEAAWKSKRYAEVVKLYSAEISNLTALEKKRLVYAEKQVSLAAR